MKDYQNNIVVLRLSHRPSRDKRVSTHLFLAARALGAYEAFYTGIKDPSLEESIKKINEEWGGSFKITYFNNWKNAIKNWDGKIVHLTMYGMPLQDVIEEVRISIDPLMIIVGGAKVPGEIYKISDWNISITNQPHSEISALALFLNEFYQGKYLKQEFENAKINIMPSKNGKQIQKIKQVFKH